jgi:trk system potassium uptake protein TrkH
MHKALVLNIVGRILLVVSVIMLIPLGWAALDDPWSVETRAFFLTIILGIGAMAGLWKALPVSSQDFDMIGAKDGLAIVGLSWISVSLLGALPFYLSGVIPSYTDAFFETVSGFTTTGATILTGIEGLPRGILFWRSLTHWLGGMGIIVLSVALLPAIGRGAYQLYRAEAPGPTAERLRPGMKETAKTLWSVYFLLSLLETVLLMTGGMTLFDALCHTFGTMATGGFSTRDASIAAYGGYIQWIIILFMFLAGCNFMLHYQALRGKVTGYFRSEEFRVYLFIVLIFVPVFTTVLWLTGGGLSEATFRKAGFQVVSILTTTGYTTADFDLWPAFLKISLVVFMFIGGCAGSTGGGMKVIRAYVALKTGFKSIIRSILPNVVMPVKVDSKPVPETYVTSAGAYFIIYIFLFCLGTAVMTVTERADLVTSFSASVACLSNIGPGLGNVGAAQNYAWISLPGKWFLSFLMLAGRLELYSILILFVPAAWRK